MAAVLLAVLLRPAGRGPASQPSPTRAASAEPVLRLNAVMAEGKEPLATGVDYVVYEAAADAEGNRKRVAGSPSVPGRPAFPLKPGRYYVAAIYGSARATTEVDIVPGTLVLQTLILHAGVLSTSSRLSSATDTLKNGVAYVVYEAAQDVEGNRKKVTSSPS